MKENLKTFLSAGIPFGMIMGVFVGISNGFYAGVVAGIVLGLLFGVILSTFVFIQRKQFRKKRSLTTDGKNIIMEGAANHFKGIESVGGWLYLTAKEIVFKSHSMNIQAHQLVIPLNQIADVKPVLTAGFVPNGLQIITISGTVEKFVVTQRKMWVQKINTIILSLH